MTIGGGSTQNYAALLLFLAGMGAAGVAVYFSQTGGRWAVATTVALLLMTAACVLVAARKDEH
ncbi:MAG TPA: hypothetical protein VF659_19595 [Pyrinomonadaceae bacterium]|jgi:hypothetical membrane protein